MRVNTEILTPGSPEIEQRNNQFASFVTQHYDQLAERWPLLAQLRAAAKVVTLVNWMRGRALVDDSWAGNEPRRVTTPSTTPAREITHVVRQPPWIVKMSVRGGVALTGTARTIPSNGAVEALMETAFSARPRITWRLVVQGAMALAVFLMIAWFVMGMRLHSVLRFVLLCATAWFILTKAEGYFPSRIAPVWSFSDPSSNKKLLAIALPLGITPLPSVIPGSPLRPLPSLSASADAKLSAEARARAVPIKFRNTCTDINPLYVNGVFIANVKAGREVGMSLPPGTYTGRFGGAAEEFEITPTYASAKLDLTCSSSPLGVPPTHFDLPRLDLPPLHLPRLKLPRIDPKLLRQPGR
jgi:hypothetical protein